MFPERNKPIVQFVLKSSVHRCFKIQFMKNKNLLLLLLGFICLGILSFYLIKSKNPNTSLVTNDRDFAVQKIDEVQKIFLAERGKPSIQLTKEKNVWMVNGKFKVAQNKINNLLFVLQKLKLESIPPKSMYETIMSTFVTNGIKVEIYTNESKPSKTYYIGGVTNDEKGLYCIMDGSVQPYIMHIDFIESNLRYRYNLSEEQWRDLYIFGLNEMDIQEASVMYPLYPEKSFQLSYTDQKAELKDNKGNPKQMNQQKMRKFLQSFTQIGTEAFENSNPIKAKLVDMTPYCIINVKTKNNQEKELKLYPINPDLESKIDMSPAFLNSDQLFRFYGAYSSGDLYLVQLGQISGIMTTLQELHQ